MSTYSSDSMSNPKPVPNSLKDFYHSSYLSSASAFTSTLMFLFLSYFKIPLPSASTLHLPSQIKYFKEQCLLHYLHYHLLIPETHCNMVSDTISPKKLASPP